MERYRNLGGNSGVLSYEVGADFIIVEFAEGRTRFYKYTYESAGSDQVEYMKELAEDGIGLNRHIDKMNGKGRESEW